MQALVLAHSRQSNDELITLLLEYPRFIHSEFLTHRTLARNSSSSRAIPTQKLTNKHIQYPSRWLRNQPGMHSNVDHEANVIDPLTNEPQNPQEAWEKIANLMCLYSEAFAKAGYHKQICNRISENLLPITTVATGTKESWDNFLSLRNDLEADPTMQVLAQTIKKAINDSIPAHTYTHSPFHTNPDISAARCARTSYLNHFNKEPTEQEDRLLARRLIESRHMSPFEHQAIHTPGITSGVHRNWTTYRHIIEIAIKMEG